jgi:hypothetical protein
VLGISNSAPGKSISFLDNGKVGQLVVPVSLGLLAFVAAGNGGVELGRQQASTGVPSTVYESAALLKVSEASIS